ncbi:MAG: hypothetical protein KJ799_01760 [Bacteroidetes bacterium]|nr:hypothetical protein [Bacteroidota bacterium]
MKVLKSILILLSIALPLSCSTSEKSEKSKPLVNLSHLDHLYEEILMQGDTVGIIHIYCEYPDYNWVGDDDEGIACVDDAARAAILYVNEYKKTNAKEYLAKAEKLIAFISKMQAENGYFYNFVWEDGSINKEFKTSEPIANWWSWRALWALVEFRETIEGSNSGTLEDIEESIAVIVANIKRDFSLKKTVQMINGFSRPDWLPFGTASDQAALMVICLTKYSKFNDDPKIEEIVTNLCEGISLMQEGKENEFPHYALMSWENVWHAWGNSQAYALLLAGEKFDKNEWIDSAINEIDHFYSYLIEEKYFNEFHLNQNDDNELKKFPQIAYGIRPMVYASLQAYKITNDEKYAVKAAKIAEWFFKQNPANAQMYFPQSGIGFDGIINQDEVNKNSGAESTIEALLSLSAIEENKISSELLRECLNSQNIIW